MKAKLFLFTVACISSVTAFAQPNCQALTSGFIPLNDLGTDTFITAWGASWQGGLYQGGSNFLPAAHKIAGMQMASQVQCLNPNGIPDPVNGKMVWLSIGMSNTTQETQQFIPLANAHPNKNPKLILVDGAMGGQSASVISAPWHANYNNYWTSVITKLGNAGVTANQVQVIWFKEADQAQAYGSIEEYYDSLLVMFPRIMNELKNRFPNVKLCYMASRISARYASTLLNPEPFSYYTGWAVKKVIDNQVNGDPQLQFSGAGANAPWLSWGIYMWSDGDTPQITNPGIFWTCPGDFQNDGTHPSLAGEQKVGALLLEFFTTDSTAIPWFLGTGCPVTTAIPENSDMTDVITLTPNPAINTFKINFGHEIRNGAYQIYDVSGKEIRNVKNIKGSHAIVDGAGFLAGFYFVKISEEGILPVILKVVIQ